MAEARFTIHILGCISNQDKEAFSGADEVGERDGKELAASVGTTACVDRRTFGACVLAAGAVAPAGLLVRHFCPSSAQGIVTATVPISSDSGVLSAYRAMPASGAGAPVAVVLHEYLGMPRGTRALCRRLAEAGFYAVAPDFYPQEGGVAIGARRELRKGAGVADDLRDVVAFSKGEGAGPRAIYVGTGAGGRFLWRAGDAALSDFAFYTGRGAAAALSAAAWPHALAWVRAALV
jgi:hypothetical protein